MELICNLLCGIGRISFHSNGVMKRSSSVQIREVGFILCRRAPRVRSFYSHWLVGGQKRMTLKFFNVLISDHHDTMYISEGSQG
jgi:hypothetical protein